MPIAQQPQEPLSWLAEDELNELNEEWIDNSSARSNSVSGEGDTGPINMKSTYDSIIIHDNDENATTKLNHGVKKDATPKWKKALQDQNSKKDYSTWNNFFQSPTSQPNSEIQETGSGSGSVIEKRGAVGTGSTTIPSQMEDSGSKSRLKVFQKHDTYTHSRLENLLGVLDIRSPHASIPVRPESAKLLNESVSNQSYHKSVNSDSDLYSSRHHDRTEWNSVDRRDITTQDFMDNANSLMKKLMGGGPELLEASPTGDSNFQTDSYESGGSNFMDNSYQNSDQELGPPIYHDHGVGQRDQGSERHASVIVHPKEPLKPAENKRNIAVIKQEDVKNIIPATIGSMNYDAENRIWRRNGKKQSSVNANNESSVAHNSTQEENDIFQGIDDLSDNIHPPIASLKSQQSRQPSSRHDAPVQNQASKQDQDDDLQQKLLSIKSCLIDTPRAAMVSGVSDKEVSFLLPGRDARPILAAAGITKPFNGDVTHISQIDTSFSHSMTHLVKALTDKYPNQMLWDKLVYIDISNCRFESLAKLNLICPSLKKLNASRNNLSVVQGIPASVTDLDLSNNKLSNLSNFGGLQNIQYLNISSNNMASFTCMSNLIHLRNLTADDCCFTNLNGLNGIDGLMQLSIQGSQLTELDGSQCPSNFLQSINVSNNKIRHVKNLDVLKSLRSLNLGKYYDKPNPTDESIANLI